MEQGITEVQRMLNYLRKSRKDEELERLTGEDTLALHEKIMDEILQPLGIPYDTIREVASGETIEGRPEFKKVLEWLEEGRYQAIAVKEIKILVSGKIPIIAVRPAVLHKTHTRTPSRCWVSFLCL